MEQDEVGLSHEFVPTTHLHVLPGIYNVTVPKTDHIKNLFFLLLLTNYTLLVTMHQSG